MNFTAHIHIIIAPTTIIFKYVNKFHKAHSHVRIAPITPMGITLKHVNEPQRSRSHVRLTPKGNIFKHNRQTSQSMRTSQSTSDGFYPH